MAVEQFANNAATQLNGGINNSVTSIDVDSATGFPTSAQYRIIIDGEILIVTAGAGTTTWTVTRGAEGTTAASHSDNAVVAQVLTRDSLKKGIGDLILSGTYASRPAAGRAGQLYIPTDGNIFYRDNGSSWDGYGPIHKFKQPPVVSSWTWVNQSTATATDQGGSILMTGVPGSGDNATILKISAPGTPYVIKTAFRVQFSHAGTGFRTFGIVLRESSTGKLKTCTLNYFDGTVSQSAYRYTNPTTFSAIASAREQLSAHPDILWLKLEDNGTNCLYSLSADGNHWFQFHSESRTTFCTHDEIGWYSALGSSSPSSIHLKHVWLMSWEVT